MYKDHYSNMDLAYNNFEVRIDYHSNLVGIDTGMLDEKSIKIIETKVVVNVDILDPLGIHCAPF